MLAFNSSDISEFTFNAVDYTVFILMLSISAAIGIYYGFVHKSENTTAEYLHGGKRMRTLPIAISLVASQLSAVAIMAIPAESYSFGINWAFNVIAMIFIIPIINYVVIPVFYNNNISNCYEVCLYEKLACENLRITLYSSIWKCVLIAGHAI